MDEKWSPSPVVRERYPGKLLLFVLLWTSALGISGCAPKPTPHLLEIEDVGPSTLEVGSEIRILGDGFPENRPGTLTLEGTLYAPARSPRGISWKLPLSADSHSQIHLPLSARSLAGTLEGAAHVTFRGSAKIEFAPIMSNRPPLTGEKDGLVLDLFADTPASAGKTKKEAETEPTPLLPTASLGALFGQPQSEKKPEQFLKFLGIAVGADLVVESMHKDSYAERAGLLVGDKLHALDGVRLDSLADFLPQTDGTTCVLEYSRRGFEGTASANLPRKEFQVLDHRVGARAIAAVLGIVLALLISARPPRFVVWLFGPKSKARRVRSEWLTEVPARLQFLAYPSFLCVVLALFFLSVDQSSKDQSTSLDTALLACLAVGALGILLPAFVLGGRRSNRAGFSLLGAFSSTVLRLLLLLPTLVSLLCRAGELGSLKLTEIAKVQGPFPTEWGLFESPWGLLLALGALLGLLPIAGRRAPVEGQFGPLGSVLRSARVVEWTGQLFLLGLWTQMFLGGSAGGEMPLWLSGLLFSTKLALLSQLIVWVRARTGQLRAGEAWGLYGASSLTLCLLAAALSLVSTFTGVVDAHGEMLRVASLALALGVVLLSIIGSQRSWAHTGRRVDLWI